ncbi:MAG TPA: signal peptide peptidase SppA [Rhodoblastus sp.]|nr:signal peptide peptidase SppA [Rhodoblastus sp.]
MYPPPPEYLAERRLLTRKLSFWRVAAFGALIVAVLAAGWRLAGDASHAGAHIARVRIAGVIKDDPELLKLVRDVTASSASAAILSIDSPGGTTTGAEALYEELRRLAAKKPTVAVVDGMAASGAYIAAIAADGIVARGNSMVGSIGVLMQMPNASKLMDTVGVKMEEIKSSPLKAAPNPYEPVTPEARAAVAAMIADSYNWFKGLVKERRKLDDAGVATVSDGRVFTGRQGLDLRLVDRIGGEREAIAWLESEKGVARGLKVRDWKKPRKLEAFGVLGALAEAAGLDRIAAALAAAEGMAQARLLDGPVAIWQGSALN